MLSFTNTRGRPIARIEGGRHDQRYIYLVNDLEGKDSYNEITLDEGKLQVIPNKDVIEKVYVSAPSGAGKSFYTGKWIGEYLKQHPNNDFFLISSIKSDKSLDKHDPVRIEINQELFNDPIHPEELKNSIIVFDDTDVIPDTIVRNAINGLRDAVLECGRHYRTNTIITSHILTNSHETKRILNEATSITIFPNTGSTYSIKRYLKEYIGLDKDEIKKLLRLKTRWLTIYTHSPQYIVYERGAMMMRALMDDD